MDRYKARNYMGHYQQGETGGWLKRERGWELVVMLAMRVGAPAALPAHQANAENPTRLLSKSNVVYHPVRKLSPTIHPLIPMSAPTTAPTQRDEPDETMPRLSEARLILSLVPPEPNANEIDGSVAQGKV